MSSSSFDKDLRDTLEESLEPQAMRVLVDILEGTKKENPKHYFGSNSPTSTNASKLARALATDHPDEARDFLDIRESEFCPKEIATNSARKFLVDNTEVDQDVAEAASKDFDLFLALVYHQFYDRDAAELKTEYDILLAKTTIFKNNNETVYYYDKPLPLDEVETRIQSYIRKANSPDDRPKTAKAFPSEETVVLKLYNETSETRKAVFKSRINEDQPNGPPEVTHQPNFNVKTMRLKAENLGDEAKITFAKSIDSWQNDLELFLEQVFGIRGGVDSLTQRTLDGASQVLERAKAVAESDSSDEAAVSDRVEEIVSELAEETVEEMEADSSVPVESVEAAKKRFESIQLQGVQVRNDGDTHIADFVLRSQDGVQETTDEVDEMEESLMALLAKADKQNINLIFRGTGLDGSNEEFEVYSGNWTTRSRGIPTEAIAAYDSLFETTIDE